MFPFRNTFPCLWVFIPISARFYFNIFQFVIFLAKQSYYSKKSDTKLKSPLRKDFSKGLINWNLYCNHFFFNSRIFFSICCITPLKSSSVFPVGSSSFQLSSNALPINGQPTSQPMEVEMSGSGMLDISLEYCFFLHVDAVKLLHETDGILIDLGRSKYDGILQEINARMILYNFCELVTSHTVVKTSKKYSIS